MQWIASDNKIWIQNSKIDIFRRSENGDDSSLQQNTYMSSKKRQASYQAVGPWQRHRSGHHPHRLRTSTRQIPRTCSPHQWLETLAQRSRADFTKHGHSIRVANTYIVLSAVNGCRKLSIRWAKRKRNTMNKFARTIPLTFFHVSTENKTAAATTRCPWQSQRQWRFVTRENNNNFSSCVRHNAFGQPS